MSEMYEIERFLEEYLEYGMGLSLLTNSFSSLLSIAAYVLTSLALYTLAKRRGIKNAWLSWVPVINCWIVGSLSDQYRYVVKGQNKNKRKTLLTLHIITWVIAVAIAVLAVVVVVGLTSGIISGNVDAIMEEIAWVPLIILLLLCLPLIGVSIAATVVHYIAMYDIYNSCSPQNSVVFLVLSIFFGITEPFFLFFTRNKDEGMPPRKQKEVYEVHQETWSQTEYL